MRTKIMNQAEFSSVLFDSLFGLILFFSLEGFLEIKNPSNFALYLFSTFILIHWWLLYKSADDIYQDEVSNSALDVLFGIIDIVLLEFIILYSRQFSLMHVLAFTIALLGVDLLWSIVWRYVGHWNEHNRYRIPLMERELRNNIITDLTILAPLIILTVIQPFTDPRLTVATFIAIYCTFIFLTFKRKLIDIKFF